jgi:pseudouridine synthase
MAEERLQKILARAGVASRRKCEELIAAGRVTVDGRIVTQMGVKVDPALHDVRFDGERIASEKKVYYVLNKPRGVLCTNETRLAGHLAGAARAIDLLPDVRERLFSVGRLDMNSEGLLILTNDGEFANRIAHPRYEVLKTYVVDVKGEAHQSTLDQLQSGVTLDGVPARATRAHILQRTSEESRLEITLKEGRKREIRRMLETMGFEVLRLKRIRIGSLGLDDLRAGEYRPLSTAEVKALLSCTHGRTPNITERKQASGPREPRRFGAGPKQINERKGYDSTGSRAKRKNYR